MSKNIIMLGLPGVGKGTNAQVMATDFSLPHISTGDIFRKAMADKTELGSKAKEYMDAGNLVPDEITNGIVAERLEEQDVKKANGFILDGFPRNPEQAAFLDSYLEGKGEKIDGVIYLEAPVSVVEERLMGRGRVDDTIEVIQHRIEVANAETMPLVDYFKKAGNLITIDATGDVDTVYQAVTDAMNSL